MNSSQPPFSSSNPESASDTDSDDEHGPRLTVTQVEQFKVEAQVAEIYRCLLGTPLHSLELRRNKHVDYLTKGLNQLGHTFQVLDANCQTYEGGIGGEPHSEAHGGYTFCGLAAMILIGYVEKLDLANLIGWVASWQGIEWGFQGRANKLVDGCYSFWQGAALALVQKLLPLTQKTSEELSSIHATNKILYPATRFLWPYLLLQYFQNFVVFEMILARAFQLL